MTAVATIARTGTKLFWTVREESILRAHYPTKGAIGCEEKLPGRTAYAIDQHARGMGLKPPNGHKNPRQFYSTSPQIDEAIRRIYQGDGHDGAVNDLARTLARPRWWIGHRAVKLGFKTPRFKQADWSEEEVEIIAGLSHRIPATIQKALARAGYKRSETAIIVKLKRIGAPTGRNADPDHYTGLQLARLFGVDLKTVTRWIAKGWLIAGRRGTDRTEQQGGDEWWIHRRDVAAFIFANPAAVDLRKVEKFWFIDLLSQPAKATKQSVITQIAAINPRMSHEEIAERSGSTPAAVKVVLSKQRMGVAA